jgi:hypothetical protein
MLNDKLEQARREQQLQRYNVNLYKFARIEEIASILRFGIYSKVKADAHTSINYQDISLNSVQERRAARRVVLSSKRSVGIHDLVGLYLVPKTPTQYVHYKNNIETELVFFDIDVNLVTDPRNEIVFSDGNAGSGYSKFYTDFADLDKLPWDVLRAPRWNDYHAGRDEGARRRASEFLIYPHIHPAFIKHLIVHNHATRDRVKSIVQGSYYNIPIEVDNSFYFTESGEDVEELPW